MKSLLLVLLAALPIAAQQRDVIRAGVDLVVVPISVRDNTGKFIYDLKPEDFTILEDGRVQQISNFSIDPSPLSVAVLIDTGLGGSALRRFASSILSLSSAFTEADEAEVYRFDHIIMRLSEFTADHETLEKNLSIIKKMAEGRTDNTSSPIAILPGRGPRWLRWLLDRGIETKVLNDAVFTAARDLESRSADKRKIIVIISDGQAAGKPVHSLQDTRDRLVQSQIQFYGVAVGTALIEGPASILRAYADATGGDVYRARTQNAMETAFSRIMVQARHQYVISYVSNNEVPGLIAVPRQIVVKANRPDLKNIHRKSYLQFPRPR